MMCVNPTKPGTLIVSRQQLQTDFFKLGLNLIHIQNAIFFTVSLKKKNSLNAMVPKLSKEKAFVR